LIGGIESVTLSDEEARRRGTQKTVLERRAAPTFDVLIEILDRERLAVHHDVAAAVDAMLRGRPLPPELRGHDETGKVLIETPKPPPGAEAQGWSGRGETGYPRQAAPPTAPMSGNGDLPFSPTPPRLPGAPLQSIRVYPYGVARSRLQLAARRMHLPVIMADDASEADAIVTLRSYYRRRQKFLSEAEARRMPVYVLRSNSAGQMEDFLSDLFNLQEPRIDNADMQEALDQTQQAIQSILDGARSVDLPPASAYLRRLQHQLARQANLVSHSYGKEPRRRVRIFRE
jgi:hypothetical protein